jgi:acyl-CoA thioesterase FadM
MNTTIYNALGGYFTMLERQSEVFLSEVGYNAEIKLGALIDKFQDIGWIHTQSILQKLPKLNANIGFFVSDQKVQILKPTFLSDKLIIQSFITNANRRKFTRLVKIFNNINNLLATQIENAFAVDLLTGKLASLPKDFPASKIIDQNIKCPILRNKVQPPLTANAKMQQYTVLGRDIDNYNHMNNARYLDLISERVNQIKEITVNYVKPAKEGMILDIARELVDHKVFYKFMNQKQLLAKIQIILE